MNGMTTDDIVQLLQTGAMEVEGFLPWSSNYTFLVQISKEDTAVFAVYKPRQGERPLWDFVQGTLCQRERAAYLVSEILGWHLIPPTIMREGPQGLGSLQLFIEHDPECHYFTIEGQEAFRQQLQQIALLDIIINNADRKGGHILLEKSSNSSQNDRLWAIDHGVCFHTNHKLRTVVWEFAGTPIPENLLSDLKSFRKSFANDALNVQASLEGLLSKAEITAVLARLDRIIEEATFWKPGPGRHYPWPPV